MRRPIVPTLLLAAGAALAASAQPPPQPPGTVLREPYAATRVVDIIAAAGEAPVELAPTGVLDLAYPLAGATLTVRVRSRHREALPASGLTLRLAVGPFDAPGRGQGNERSTMVSLRMQPQTASGLAASRHATVEHLAPGIWESVVFSRVPADPALPILVMRRQVRVIATLERVTDADDEDVWTNPDSRELLWKALRAVTYTEPRRQR